MTKLDLIASKNPISNNDQLIWLASTVSLSRNVQRFNFPGKLDTASQKQIISLVKNQLGKLPVLKNPVILPAEELQPSEKEFLVEYFLTLQSFHQSQSGEGFIIDESGRFLTTLNVQDHITLSLIDDKAELEQAWNQLVEIESKLGEAISYSYSQKFGFLTADPQNCGTGLRAAAFLQLSGLIHTNKIDETLARLQDDSIRITGIQGSPSEIIGDIIMVQNSYSLGITEENIISTIRTFCTKLHAEEKTARKKILEEDSADIKDRISRAYGILVHSYNIEAIEALNALSLLKLGIQFGWVTGMTIQQVNRLFSNCRRAHLLAQLTSDLPQEEISHKRAAFIHENLKSVALAPLLQ